MRFMFLAVAVAALVASGAGARNPIAMDTPVKVSGIETVCTGIGSAADDPRWRTYPVRVEFSNKRHEWVSDVDVVLKKPDGPALATLFCPANWVLFRLEPGDYVLTATAGPDPGDTASIRFSAPASGQRRVVLVFTGAATN